MRNVAAWFGFGVMSLLLVSACGGGSGGGKNTSLNLTGGSIGTQVGGCANDVTIYGGTYDGSWINSQGDKGTIVFTVTGSTISGKITDQTAKTSYTLGGTVAHINCPLTDVTITEQSDGSTTTFTGTINIEDNNYGEFYGSFSESGKPTVQQAVSNCVKQPV